MTWVIGIPTYFGYCAGYSDIQVSFQDKSTSDCLQKIYPVGPCIALGFAGSVHVGFKMVGTLMHFLKDIPPKMGWIPSEVAKWWQLDAQDVFNSCPEEERNLGCHLMLFGVHPSKKEKELANRGELYRFRSPNFTPLRAKEFQVVSIGSGNSVKSYVRKLREITKYPDGLMQLETHRPGGMAFALSHSLTDVIQKDPTKGISSHLHVCTVGPGRTDIAKNDSYYIGESSVPDFVMPPVVPNYPAFLAFAKRKGIAASCATC